MDKWEIKITYVVIANLLHEGNCKKHITFLVAIDKVISISISISLSLSLSLSLSQAKRGL